MSLENTYITANKMVDLVIEETSIGDITEYLLDENDKEVFDQIVDEGYLHSWELYRKEDLKTTVHTETELQECILMRNDLYNLEQLNIACENNDTDLIKKILNIKDL